MTPRQAVEWIKENKAEMVDFKFQDFLGIWQHFSVPISQMKVSSFEEGFGFDGSSIRAWQPIQASDMLVIPDPDSVKMDPFCAHPTATFICNIFDPVTKEPYSRDPRYIAQKAESYLKATDIGDTAYFGPEAEFFIFDSVRFDQSVNHGFYEIDSEEGHWNSGREESPNLGYKLRPKEGYFPVPPADSLQDLRTEMAREMEELGIEIECQHHEVATAGQAEIDMKYASLVQMADNLMWFKYVTKNVAKRHNKTVTFMPKPLYGDNGSGMHVHCSIWKKGKPLFAGEGPGGLSEMALHFIGGILHHAPAVCAFTNPTTNSYRRLVPGFEAPVTLVYSVRNRSAAIRIPVYSSHPAAKRIEFRTPDPSCNPYLAFAAILMAGLDGIEKKMDPGKPLDKEIYGLSEKELKQIPAIPASLEEALNALEKNCDFLLKGGVFTEDVIQNWLRYKRERELSAIRSRPVPYEFTLYYDV
ncbi:MAG: type I glutamate--ammonia ligase [Deltaproteobacteria bacterium]|nr:type I glutamate--ammonia ligase [Deltaproteobacteria bacterium]